MEEYAVACVLGESGDYGARPLRRFVEKDIVTLISKRLLEEGESDEGCVITVLPPAKPPLDTQIRVTIKKKRKR
jgi:ATP-dependent Clp protease ATP-binding subunit ClpA